MPGKSRRSRNDSKRAARTATRAGAARPSSSAITTAGSAASGDLKQHGTLFLVLAVMALVALVRLRVADVPLERDEGEYAYAGQLILQGIPPYQLAWNMKFPGTYYAYSLIMSVFGQTAWGIHVGLIIVNGASTILLFFLGRKVLGQFGGAVAAIAFAIFSLDRWTMGVFAHATHFVVLPMIAGFLVLLRGVDSHRASTFIGAGALLGIAVLMKQQAIFFLPLAFGLVLWNRNVQPRDLRGIASRSALLALGALIPFAALCALFAVQGVFGKFWFWTFQYAREYVSEIPLSVAWANFAYGWRTITQANLWMWLLAAAGVLMIWLVRWSTDVRVFLTGFLLASMLSVSPGFYFRQHYFILLLPVAALFVGAACTSVKRMAESVVPATAARAIAVALFAGAAGMYAVSEEDFLVSLPARDLSRSMYSANPFIEAVDIAAYIQKNTKPSDRIAVLGSEPEIYFYANRKSATGYIYTYPLMENQRYAERMQDEMIREVETARPAYIVFVAIGTSWLARTPNEKILSWAARFTRDCYDMAGIADIHSFESSTLVWDRDVAGYQPRSPNIVYTFRRRADAPCTALN